jgi:flavin-dependent dehydrogenase
MGVKDGRVAIIGASMAGLLAARVLADIASEVLIIERDTPPEQPESRKGVPQGRHAHALLRAGALIIEDLFPDPMTCCGWRLIPPQSEDRYRPFWS